MTTETNPVVEQLQTQVETKRQQREEHTRAARQLDQDITRIEAAIAALSGEAPGRFNNKRSRTAGMAILAAHTSFGGKPVNTSTLLDHEDLVHYSRQTLRGALSELHRGGQLTPRERSAKGFIW